jgi:WD40 repeat protein
MKDGKVYTCLRDLEKMGHRSDVRVVCFSSDGLAVATGSAEAVKVWNRPSRSCMRTLDTAYVYSLCFVPGDRHLLIGQDGKLLVADVGSAEILEEIPAHEKEIWSIVMQPDQVIIDFFFRTYKLKLHKKVKFLENAMELICGNKAYINGEGYKK